MQDLGGKKRDFREDLTEAMKSGVCRSTGKQGSLISTDRIRDCQTMGMLGMKKNMHSYHQPFMNMNLNMQPRNFVLVSLLLTLNIFHTLF